MRHLLSAAILLAGLLPAQQPEPAAATLDLDGHLPWIRDSAVFFDGFNPKRSLTRKEQAVDRPAMMDTAIARAKAEDKLVLWYVYRIVEDSSRGFQMYRAPVLDIYTQQVLFADPDVASIVARRFVPLRMVCDEAMSERFGLRPLDFVEPAMVFVDGDGNVVHFVERIRTFDALWFADLLRRVLAANGNPGTLDTETTPIDELTANGQWEAALARCTAAKDPDLVAEAALLRRLRHPADALQLLDRAAEQLGSRDREGRAAVDLERGRVLAMTGKLLDARDPLELAWRAGLPEAGYLGALDQLRMGDESGAMTRFELVATRYPDTLAGRRAKADSTLGPDERPLGAAFAGFEHYGYLPDAAYEGLPRDTTWAGDAQDPKEMAVRGMQFLLSQQRDDGGFTDARYAYWPDTEITPNTWVAITAIACTALLEFRDIDPTRVDPAAVDAALEKGEAFLMDPKRLRRGKNEDSYSDTYRLIYFARKAAKRPGTKAHDVDEMNGIVAAAQKRQHDNGFFAHEYENAFCTGAMMWGLLAARDAGAEVPDEMFSKGVAALLSARADDGAYRYSGTAARRRSSLKDASARMPLCEGVLLRLASTSKERFDFALKNYWGHMDRIERVRRNDFHSDGELAGFFFFHDLFHTSEVVNLLPEEEQAPIDARFLALLQKIPEMDGSFVDSHEFGRSYGTAMALLTLKNVATFD